MSDTNYLLWFNLTLENSSAARITDGFYFVLPVYKIMDCSLSLFDRISTCARAIRFLKENNNEYSSSYEEVLKFLPSDTVTTHKNANLIKASLLFLKLGFADRDTPVRKVNIALYVAIAVAEDHGDRYGLTKEICDRFRSLENFDREQMMKIFNFSLCNERVLALLDKSMAQRNKIKNVGAAIDHELRVEFIVLYFNAMKSLVRRGEPIAELGYSGQVTCSDMEAAKLVVNKHASSIATKYWPCFDLDVLKKPRPRNILFPAGGAFPRVSIVREHLDFDEVSIGTLKDSLLDKKQEKEPFVEIMRAMISLSPDEPVVTYRNMKLESSKAFFLETILNKAQAKEMQTAVSELSEVDSLKKENAALKAQVSDRVMLGERYRSVVMMLSSVRDERDELKIINKNLEDENWLLRAEVESKKNLPSRKNGRDKKVTMDKFWMMEQEE